MAVLAQSTSQNGTPRSGPAGRRTGCGCCQDFSAGADFWHPFHVVVPQAPFNPGARFVGPALLASGLALAAGPSCTNRTFVGSEPTGGASAGLGGSVASGGAAGTAAGGLGGETSGGSGGSAPDGGAPSGGSSGDGAGGATCPEASTLVRLETATPNAYCVPACATGWLKILREGNAPASYDPHPRCDYDCKTCQPRPCSLAPCEAAASFSEALEVTFTGSYFVTDSCQETTCSSQHCLPGGDYVAEFCLERRDPASSEETCLGTGVVDCAWEAFTWPLDATVTGTLNKPTP